MGMDQQGFSHQLQNPLLLTLAVRVTNFVKVRPNILLDGAQYNLCNQVGN